MCFNLIRPNVAVCHFGTIRVLTFCFAQKQVFDYSYNQKDWGYKPVITNWPVKPTTYSFVWFSKSGIKF